MRGLFPVGRRQVRSNRWLSRHNPEEKAPPWEGAADGYRQRELDRMLEEAIEKVGSQNIGYRRLLSGLNRRVSKTIPLMNGKEMPFSTACVRWVPYRHASAHEMFFNPDLLVHLTPEQRAGVVEHELLHIVLWHTTKAPKNVAHNIFNLAADCTVNRNVKFDLPDWVVTLERSFPICSLTVLMSIAC